MTTAHRPTWAPAKGSEEQGGARYFGASKQYSARDIASHTTLKERQPGQGNVRDLEQRDLKAELEGKEHKHFAKKRGRGGEDGQEDLRLEAAPSSRREQPPEQRLQPKALDADDSADENENLEEDSDSDDDEDDTAELMKELERIKKERAEETARKQAEDETLERAARKQELAKGNPLLQGAGGGGSFQVKRRWDDDVVFKNQARTEPKKEMRFINDTIRNDFHRRFLNKYMK